MTFIDFCRSLGIVIEQVPPVGRWVRLPTDDKPKHRNGAVKFMGDHGFAQNHATQTEVAVWKPAGDAPQVDHAANARRVQAAQREIETKQRAAAERAEWILSQCELAKHPYLERKGFPDEVANVWDSDTGRLLVIPMRVGDRIVGCQLIDGEGEKRFLSGQRTSDAAFVINNRGPAVLCEGYATALSIRAALTALKARYTLFVCFSAHNLGRIAKTLPTGLVVSDNDASFTGQRVAQESGWPYWVSDVIGEDFNDAHKRLGLFKVTQSLRKSLLESK